MENTAGESEKKISVCPHCKKEIDPAATKCPHCQSDLRSWAWRHKILTGVLGVFAFFCVMSVIGAASSHESSNQQQSAADADATQIQNGGMSPADYAAWQKTPAGKLCAKNPTWTVDTCNNAVAGKIWIGMPMMAVVYERGNPDHTNVSNYGNGNEYQFCWDDYTPSCFYASIETGGLVTSYN